MKVRKMSRVGKGEKFSNDPSQTGVPDPREKYSQNGNRFNAFTVLLSLIGQPIRVRINNLYRIAVQVNPGGQSKKYEPFKPQRCAVGFHAKKSLMKYYAERMNKYAEQAAH